MQGCALAATLCPTNVDQPSFSSVSSVSHAGVVFILLILF